MEKSEALKQVSNRNFVDKLYQFSYQRCSTSWEAEDLCSDIVFALLSAIANQEKIDHFNGFVWTVAHRVYADFCAKRNKSHNTVSIESNDFQLESKNDEIEKLIEEIESEENLKKIFSEIAFLSKVYREVMVKFYIEELKIKDIAVQLHISENAVKQRLFSAHNTVRKEVKAMNNRNLSLKPVKLVINGTGNPIGNDPRQKAERTFSQNLIYLCKEKPKTAKELSDELCIPMTYIEEELEIQCRGENGSYGMLRKLDNGKYVTNILLVDSNEYDEANQIYEKYLPQYCSVLKENFEKQKNNILSFPYLVKQTDAHFILWSLISETIWDFQDKVQILAANLEFKDIEPSRRPFTCAAIAYRDGQEPVWGSYGCDGINAYSIAGYKSIFISNIYGKRMDSHFHCAHDISNDPKLLMLIRSIEKLSLDELNEQEKEIAAKCIQCGYLRRSENRLLPQIIIFEKKFENEFHNLSRSLNEGADFIMEKIAKELSSFMKKHIPEHLLNEYHIYTNLIAGTRFLSAAIDECIKYGLLKEVPNRLGAEGMIMTVER